MHSLLPRILLNIFFPMWLMMAMPLYFVDSFTGLLFFLKIKMGIITVFLQASGVSCLIHIRLNSLFNYFKPSSAVCCLDQEFYLLVLFVLPFCFL